MDLKGALVKAGVVTEDKLKQIEKQQKWKENYRNWERRNVTDTVEIGTDLGQKEDNGRP